MPRATIRDVARKSGYSIATVSLVLNHKNVSIPQSTRERIWDAAQKLSYRPNQLAVSMITKRTKVLGLIIPDNSNAFFADLSKAVERAARSAGYGLIYGNTNNDPKRDLDYIKMFSDRQVDGIIFAKSVSLLQDDEEKSVQYIRESTIPFVTVDRTVQGSDARSVMLNHFKGGYLATRYLIELGHHRIGCFTGPKELVSSNERLEGYRSALAEANLPYRDELIFEGDYQIGHEEAALEHFLNYEVSAVFCFNDLMAFGLYREMKTHGLTIPNSLSIIGFDDILFSDIIHPGLTTIQQPVAQIGECAVRTLVQILEGKDLGKLRKSYLFEPRLIVRQSTMKFIEKEPRHESLKSRFIEFG